MSSSDAVNAVLSSLLSMGANVTVGPVPTVEQIAAEEARLGFSLPAEYKEFLLDSGSISIELLRTWLFYGLPEPKQPKAQYIEAFAEAECDTSDESPDAMYVPTRFVVLADEGDYSNQGEGIVYDRDLEHIRWTDGFRYVERREFKDMGYWEMLEEQLDAIVTRVADPSDPLVSECAEEANARRKFLTTK